MKIRDFLVSFLFIVFISGNVFAGEITVAVAASVQYPFEEIQNEFKNETGIILKSVVGSSGKLTAQIENGAPFDVFLSADTDYPEALVKEGHTASKAKVYAFGALVLWTFNDMNLSRGLEILADETIKNVAIASPKTAPYGRQSVTALQYYRIYDKVERKLVYGESIAQTNQFIASKAADAGITAKSVVLAPNMKSQGQWIEIDKAAYEPISQAVVILKYAQKEHLGDAQKFFDFLFSDKARQIFKKYGYILP